ncbi:hypothetical protein, partial [Cupriavidus sp. UYPR2.512]|uniref:hypothetical protein n=1 Tax=Cupriavidus sp. UYPR2.512 TaxID=1080187 RepID=UPI0006865B78
MDRDTTREERTAARDHADEAAMLRAHARKMRTFLEKWIPDSNLSNEAEFVNNVVPGDAEENFTLSTPFGLIHARFGFCFHGNQLAARYEFCSVATGDDGAVRLTPFHGMILDYHGRATYSDGGDYEWDFDTASIRSQLVAPIVVRTLLFSLVQTLPKIPLK